MPRRCLQASEFIGEVGGDERLYLGDGTNLIEARSSGNGEVNGVNASGKADKNNG